MEWAAAPAAALAELVAFLWAWREVLEHSELLQLTPWLAQDQALVAQCSDNRNLLVVLDLVVWLLAQLELLEESVVVSVLEACLV